MGIAILKANVLKPTNFKDITGSTFMLRTSSARNSMRCCSISNLWALKAVYKKENGCLQILPRYRSNKCLPYWPRKRETLKRLLSSGTSINFNIDWKRLFCLTEQNLTKAFQILEARQSRDGTPARIERSPSRRDLFRSWEISKTYLPFWIGIYLTYMHGKKAMLVKMVKPEGPLWAAKAVSTRDFFR